MILTETKCLQCKKLFLPSNKRNIYCTDGCKQDAYRERKGIVRPNFLPDLKGNQYHVFKSEDKRIVYSRVHTREFTDKQKEIERLNKELSSLKKEVKVNEVRIHEIKNRNDVFFLKRGAAIMSGLMVLVAGWVIFSVLKYLWKFTITKVVVGFVFVLPTVILAIMFGYKSQKKDDKEHMEELANLNSFENVLKDAQNRVKSKELEIIKEETELSAIPEFELLTEEKIKEIEESIKQPKYGIPEIRENDAKETMSLRDLQRKQFKTLNFTGEWEKLIGKPEQNFSMMIYGQSGHGKSYLGARLSEYLANNFGTVLYNSSEEGVSLSLQEKLKKLNSDSLRISNFKNFESIRKFLKMSSSKFIVIDSVNHMSLTPDQVEELKKLDTTRGFITIHQVTKTGEFKGDNKFLHNCDVEIVVNDRVPIVKKNRYKVG